MTDRAWTSHLAACGAIVTVVLFFCVWGAGMFSGALALSSAILCGTIAVLAPWSMPRFSREGICVTLFAAFLMLTVTPLPARLLPAESHRAHQNALARDAIQDALRSNLAHEAPGLFALTRNQPGTCRYILLVITAAAAAALVMRLPAGWRSGLLQAVVLLGGVLAAAGFYSQHVYPQGRNLWWVFPIAHGADTAGCFVNRNHFGGFVAMLAPAALALGVTSCRRRRSASGIAYIALSVVLCLIVAASRSRGAMLAGAAGMSVAALVLWVRHPLLGFSAAAVLLLAIAIALRFLPLPDVRERMTSLGRLLSTESARMRLSTWRDSLRIVRDYPVAGIGANAFRMVFPQYRTATTRKTFFNAENEYVQIVVETGVIGALLLGCAVAFSARTWRRHARSGVLPLELTVATAGALAAAGVHAAFDFTLRNPLYTLTFAVLAAMVLGDRACLAGDPPPPDPAALAPRRVLRVAPVCLGLVFAINLMIGGGWIHERDDADLIRKASGTELSYSLAACPTSWQVWYHLSRLACLRGDAGDAERCAAWMEQAGAYNPNDYRLWTTIADMRSQVRKDAAGAQRAYDRARQLRAWLPKRQYGNGTADDLGPPNPRLRIVKRR